MVWVFDSNVAKLWLVHRHTWHHPPCPTHRENYTKGTGRTAFRAFKHVIYWRPDCGPCGLLLYGPWLWAAGLGEARWWKMKNMIIRRCCWVLMGHWGALHHWQGHPCCLRSQSVCRVSDTWTGLATCDTLAGRRPPHPDWAVTGLLRGAALFSL